MQLKDSSKHIHSNDLNYRSNNIDISSMLDKYFNNVCISIITCIMKGRPSTLLCKQTNKSTFNTLTNEIAHICLVN